jgi:hypothetical protein
MLRAPESRICGGQKSILCDAALAFRPRQILAAAVAHLSRHAKFDYEWPDQDLSPKSESFERSPPQSMPAAALGVGHIDRRRRARAIESASPPPSPVEEGGSPHPGPHP